VLELGSMRRFVTDHVKDAPTAPLLLHYYIVVIIYYAYYCRNENSKLPVPFNILSMFGDQDKPCVQDDPTLHEGRIRSFAHERGNWASLIYIPCECLNIIPVISFLVMMYLPFSFCVMLYNVYLWKGYSKSNVLTFLSVVCFKVQAVHL